MMTCCMPENVRRNPATMSGFRADTSPNAGKGWIPDEVASGGVVNWLHKPIISGICNCAKYIPLQFLGQGLVLEWALAPMTSGISTEDNYSTAWHISDVRVQASAINRVSSISEAYAAHILSRKSLLIPCKTFTATSSALPDSNDHESSTFP